MRYPEPDDSPDPRAQWDEVRGVWERWNQDRQVWEELGEPLAGDDVGMAGDRGGPTAVDLVAIPGLGLGPNHEQRASSISREGALTGVGGDVAHVSIQAEAIDRINEAGDIRVDEILRARANRGVPRFPEPSDAPSSRAQWDEIRGVWEEWDADGEEWVEISVPLAGDDVGMAGARGPARALLDPDEVGVHSPMPRTDEPEQPGS